MLAGDSSGHSPQFGGVCHVHSSKCSCQPQGMSVARHRGCENFFSRANTHKARNTPLRSHQAMFVCHRSRPGLCCLPAVLQCPWKGPKLARFEQLFQNSILAMHPKMQFLMQMNRRIHQPMRPQTAYIKHIFLAWCLVSGIRCPVSVRSVRRVR